MMFSLKHDWTRHARVVSFAALAVLLAVLPAFGQAEKPEPANAYRVQPGDEIAVAVLPLKELDSQSIVSPDGSVYLKNIGQVKAAGATVAEIQEQIRVLLLKRLKNPRVTVTLAKLVKPVAAPRVTVLGSVPKPGPLELEDGLRVRKAIELAGGAEKDADLSRIVVISKEGRRTVVNVATDERAADPAQNRLVAADDSIYVPALSRITVIGAVGKPGPVDLEEGLRIRKAIELAGGANKDADLSEVSVLHRDLTRSVVDLSSAQNATDGKHNLLLLPGDSVEVTPLPKITVSGAVTKPGPVDLEEGLRARKAIDLAGGAMKESDLSRVVVIRKDLSREVIDLSSDAGVTDPKQNLLLRPGDSIDVPLPFKVGSASIRGEGILNPGSYELKAGWGLDDLIVAAGKLTLVADTEKIQHLRNGKLFQTIDLMKKLDQGAEGKVVLEPGDEIYIPRHESVVVLVGPVPNPGPRALRKGQRVSEFLREGDPQTTLALDPSKVDFGKAELHRKGQPPLKFSLKRVLGNPDDKQNLALQNGDMLFLPPKEPKQKAGLVDWLRSVPYIGMFANLL